MDNVPTQEQIASECAFDAMVADEQRKQDLVKARDLKRVQTTGRMSWTKAESFIAHGLITGTMQNYSLTEKGMALLLSLSE